VNAGRRVRVAAALGAIVVGGMVAATVVLPAGAKVAGSNGLIAFSRFDPALGDNTVYIANPDGSQLRQVFPGVQTSAPHWSPDGTQLAMQAGDDNPCPPCAASTIIWNPDTNTSRVLSPPDSGLSTQCSLWSPDATEFACEVGSNDGSRNGIYTIRTSDGGGLTQITSNPGGDDVPIDFSPDGTKLVFGRLGDSHACTNKNAIYVVNLDGSGLHQITPGGFCDDDGSWSPDGKEIAFVTNRGSLFLVHPDGTGLRQIPLAKNGRAFAGDVTWSPDGTKLAFILATPINTPNGGPNANFQEGIATANADGSNIQWVTISPTFDHETDWGTHPIIQP
jgi:Tol biopolymer transport system component